MPYVNLQVTKGATRAQKEAIVREFTDVLVRVLGKRPESTPTSSSRRSRRRTGASPACSRTTTASARASHALD